MYLHPFKTANQFAVEQKHGGRISFIFALILTFILSTAAQAAPGDLDTSFGNGGRVNSGGGAYGARDVAIQTDGKIVVTGSSTDAANRRFTLARYNTDGSLDTSFGSGGWVITPFGYTNESASAVTIQSDGKIVVVGGAYVVALVARYNPDGSLDNSFDGDGKLTFSIANSENYLSDVAILPDGKIIAAGSAFFDFALVRLTQNGSLDTDFGTGGIVVTNIGSGDFVAAIVIQTDGKIVLAGEVWTSGNQNWAARFTLVRYNSNGSLDTTYGSNGISRLTFGTGDNNGEHLRAAAIQTDGKIIAAGSVWKPESRTDFALARYNTDGSFDTTFGIGGKVTTPMGSNTNEEAQALAIQSNGKIIAAGGALIGGSVNGSVIGFTLARYNTDGSLDTSFGTGGKVLTPPTADDLVRGLAIQRDGKIVAVGSSQINSTGVNFLLARYNGDRNRSTQFDFDGDSRSDVSVYRPSLGGWYILNSANSSFSGTQFGISTDKLAPADFDGDGRTDISVFRDGYWYRLNSSNGAFSAVYFGQAGDAAVPADYDGDGKADQAVFRQGNWYILGSQVGFYSVAFGISTDMPTPADFDGDGKTDIAVFRDGNWYILGSQAGFYAIAFGQTGDKPVQADYDGDSKADPAVFRNGAWYLLRSSQGFTGIQFGNATDIPAPADYDGDGKADLAVFRDGVWYLLQSTNGFTAVQFGASADKPVPHAFVP